MSYPLKSMSLGEILDVSFQVFRDNLVKMVTISLALQVPYYALLYLYGAYLADTSRPIGETDYVALLLGLLGGLVIQPLTNGASTKLIAERYRGRQASVGTSFASALKLLPGFLGAVLLSGLFIGIGTLLLVIPGIFLSVKLSLIAPATIVERKGGTTAMSRSFELTKGSGWKIFAMFLVMYAMSMAAGILGGLVGLDYGIGYLVLEVGIAVLVGAFFAAVWAVTYFACRCEREGFDLEVLASSFDD